MALFYLKKVQRMFQQRWERAKMVFKDEDDGGLNYGELDEVSDDTGKPLPRKFHQVDTMYLSTKTRVRKTVEKLEGPVQENVDDCRRCCYFYCCCCCPFSTRFGMALMSSIGFCISFGIRCNMGLAILKMTDNKTAAWSNIVPTILGEQNRTVVEPPEFDWPPSIVGLVDSSFFWGYLITQIPGGYLASRLPANLVFGSAIAMSSFLNLLLPGACRVHYALAMFVRILQGLVEGVTYPACHGIWRHWAPPMERSRLATISFCGSYAGAVVGMPLSGILTDYLGWDACFYVYGWLGIIWFIGWFLMSSDKPANHVTITEDERLFIENATADSATLAPGQKIPWIEFLKSPPVYAIIIANFCRSWSFYLMIITQPKYFKDAFKFDIAKSGVLSALPHLVMTIIVPIGGYMADYLRRKKLMSTTNVRKLFNCGGFGLEAVFLLGVGFTKDTTTAITCLTIAVGFSGFAISGFNVNHLDIAPRYASILMGMSNGVGTLAGMFCPIVAESITKHGTVQEWETVYLIASAVHFLGVAFYLIFASGEKQPWADPPATPTGPQNLQIGKRSFSNDYDNDDFMRGTNGGIELKLDRLPNSYGTLSDQNGANVNCMGICEPQFVQPALNHRQSSSSSPCDDNDDDLTQANDDSHLRQRNGH